MIQSPRTPRMEPSSVGIKRKVSPRDCLPWASVILFSQNHVGLIHSGGTALSIPGPVKCHASITTGFLRYFMASMPGQTVGTRPSGHARDYTRRIIGRHLLPVQLTFPDTAMGRRMNNGIPYRDA